MVIIILREVTVSCGVVEEEFEEYLKLNMDHNKIRQQILQFDQHQIQQHEMDLIRMMQH